MYFWQWHCSNPYFCKGTKINKKDHQIWLKSSDWVKNSNAAHQLTATWHPPQSVWCPVMIDVLFVDEQVILASTALMPSVMAVINLATLHRTVPTRFLHQEHRATKTDPIQGINIPTPKGTDHTPAIMVPAMGDIQPHCSSLCHHLADRCPHHHSCHDTNWHSHIPSHTHHFSYRLHLCHSTHQSWSCSSNSH